MLTFKALIATSFAIPVAALCHFPMTALAQKIAAELPRSALITVEPNVADAAVENALFAQNGQYLATFTDNAVRLWDIGSGRPLRVLEDFAYINDVKISADSRTIMTSSKDGLVKHWDAKTGRKKRTEKLFESDGDRFNSVRKVPKTNQIVFTTSSGLVGLWDRGTQTSSLTVKISEVLGAYGSAEDARLSGGGKQVIIASNTDDRPTVIAHIDRSTGHIAQKVVLPKGWQAVSGGLVSTRHVLASSNGPYLNCASNLALFQIKNTGPVKIFSDNSLGCPTKSDGSRDHQNDFGAVTWFQRPGSHKIYIPRAGRRGLAVWDLREQNVSRMARWYKSNDAVLAFSAAIDRIALKRGDTIEVLSAQSGKLINTLRGHGRAARPRTTYDPDSLLLYTDYETGHETVRWSVSRIAPVRQRFKLESGFSIAHSLVEKSIALAVHDDGRMALVSSRTGRSLNAFRLKNLSDAWRTRLSPDGKVLLAKVGQDAVLLDLASKKVLKAFKPRNYTTPNGETDEEYVTTFAFSNDGKHFGVGWWGGAAEVWKTGSQQRVAELPRGDDQTTSLEFSGDGHYLIGGSRDSGIFVWHIGSRKLLQTLSRSSLAGHVSTGSATISEDGQLVAAGPMQRAISSGDIGRERRIHVWDTYTGQLKFLLKGHQSNVAALTFSSDRRWIISADYSGTIRYWSRETGKLTATFVIGANGNWAIVTDIGFFAASSGAGNLLSVVRGYEAVSVDQLWQSLYNPDLVREHLTGDANGEVATALQTADLGKILDSGPAPRVEIVSKIPSPDRSDVYDVTIKISDLGSGIGRIEWRVNGIVSAIARVAASQASKEVALMRRVVLDPGENDLRVVAYNAGNILASKPARAAVRNEGRVSIKPTLHVLAIGIDSYVDRGWTPPGTNEPIAFGPLSLAVKDANSLSLALKQAAGKRYGQVKVTTVVNKDASRQNLIDTVDRLALQIDPRDTFVLFAAGHGISHAGRFFFIPQDYQGGSNPESLKSNAVGQELIQDWLSRIKARKALILLDTCESGALISGYLRSRVDAAASDAAVGRLHEATGRPVLTAAAAGQFAHEGIITGAGTRHGIFTWSLLDALRNGDANANGVIELSELVGHVQQLVPRLAADLGGLARAAAAARQPVFGEQNARFGSRGEDFPLVGRLQ